MPELYPEGCGDSWRVLEQKRLTEPRFEKSNGGVRWQDPQREWSQRSFSLYLSWVTDGEIEAQGGRRRWEAWLSLEELTQGREGQVWLLGWGLGEGSLAQPHGHQASFWAGMRVGMPRRPGRLGRDGEGPLNAVGTEMGRWAVPG